MARNAFSGYSRVRRVTQGEESAEAPSGEQDGVTYGETQTLGGEGQRPAEAPQPAPQEA